ncbi:hypothetical protein APC1461_0848 [Bifidobacterium longum]|uniref:PIN domain-containing protein n=1 Tax=Bifidobacterium longum TaxID=216816 RepID=A0A2N0TKG1_BIFLN|nr:PIN domain-containing protein [Bifidobacterium longum]PKD15250.1 hypothetical protein APC1461_0848 [Bifidobacterium longum]
MVTMLLTSIFRNASSAVHEVEPHPQGKRVAFIPTASAVEPFRKRPIMMDQAFPESSIHVEESEWSQFDLPDPDDRHVLAAAAQGQADALTTRNIKDFPQKLLDSFSIQVITPDDLLCVLLRRNPEATASAIRELIDSRHRPPINIGPSLFGVGGNRSGGDGS